MAKDVVVIGGGASGLVAAIKAAEQGGKVVLLEASERVGAKILATGNGRCNLTNTGVSPQVYNCPAFVTPTLKNYDAKRIRQFFEHAGLMTVEEREGRVYPLSNTANSVLDVLRLAVERLGVHVFTDFEVAKVVKSGPRFSIASSSGIAGTADKVIVATGGGSELLAGLGHTLLPFQPVLCSLATDTAPLRGLSGVRAKCRLSAFDIPRATTPFFQEEGEVLFRDYGISGIVVFNASRHVFAGQIIKLDFIPGIEADELGKLFAHRLKQHDAVTNAQVLCGIFHPRIITALLRCVKMKPSALAQAEQMPALVKACKEFTLKVKGVGDANHAQVTRGGALVDEFDPNTLESLKVPGLYAVGETLNVDGACGGYNLHWAWASGMVAGSHAAE